MVLQQRPLEISLLLQHAAHSAANLHHNKALPAASRDPQIAAGGKCLMVSWVVRYIWLSLLVCLLELFHPAYLLKKFQGHFGFFSPSHSYEFQTFSSSVHKWAPLWSLNDKPNFVILTQILTTHSFLNTSAGIFHADGQCQKGHMLLLPFYSHIFPQYVPVTSRTVDFNLPCLLETTAEHSFQKGLNLSHNICLCFMLIKFLPAFFFFFFLCHCKRVCLSNDTGGCGTCQGEQSIRSRKISTDISPREWLWDGTGNTFSGSKIPRPGPCCRQGIFYSGQYTAGLWLTPQCHLQLWAHLQVKVPATVGQLPSRRRQQSPACPTSKFR